MWFCQHTEKTVGANRVVLVQRQVTLNVNGLDDVQVNKGANVLSYVLTAC